MHSGLAWHQGWAHDTLLANQSYESGDGHVTQFSSIRVDSDTFAPTRANDAVSAGVAKLQGPPQEEKLSEYEADREGQGQDLEGVLMSLLFGEPIHACALAEASLSWAL